MERAQNRARTEDFRSLAEDIRRWAQDLGFQQAGISDTDVGDHAARLRAWLDAGRHGTMGYMARHEALRARPEALQPGTLRVISVRMDYLPQPQNEAEAALDRPEQGYIARYALGRDYHRLMRRRLQALALRIEAAAGRLGHRAFVDSAPVLEKALAQKAGIGWIGKHTNLIHRRAGSWFFLGELFTDLPLPVDAPASAHCGTCRACLDVCPTQAIVAPYELDARRCISYLTIELRGTIPEPLRPLLGNRIYGCDDCQLVCPWNKFARMTAEADFLPRGGLAAPQLVDLFAWEEAEFLRRTEGSPIRRIGYACWLRNIAVALGNAPTDDKIVAALKTRAHSPFELVREHTRWALRRHGIVLDSDR